MTKSTKECVPSEDSDQPDLSLCWAHKSICWFCHAEFSSVSLLVLNSGSNLTEILVIN